MDKNKQIVNIGCIWEWVAKLEKIVAQVKICYLPKT